LVEHAQTAAFEFKLRDMGEQVERYDVGYWGHTMAFLMSEEANRQAIEFLKRHL